DVLEIRTLRMPRLYDLSWTKPPPLVERYLRTEVDERLGPDGSVVRELHEADVERAVRYLVDRQVEAIAVCLLHSYANPAHEKLVKSVVNRLAPGLPVCISAEILPEIKEYERTSTTVINTYVMPIVQRYLDSLTGELTRIGVRAPLLLMQSNGGLTTVAQAAAMPMHIIESGPAAGVVGVQALARQIGVGKALSFDMGGTTAKASLIENFQVTRAAEYSVGGGIMVGSRLLSGAGYTLKVPAIDLAEVGAGGGSKLWIDAGGALQVGPQSAGSSPGPVCYDAGGTDPTVTDANVVLGYINPRHLVGGALPLAAGKARAALEQRIARPMRMSLEQAAYGAHLIAASNMIRAIKAVSSERGRDPRDYALVAFGGNGPLFACAMAQSLGIGRVLVPPAAGVFSSFGLLYSDIEYHLTKTHKGLLSAFDPAVIEASLAQLEAEARARLREDGFADSEIAVARSAMLHYHGQSFELEVPIPPGPVDPNALEEAYGAEHERTYGHRAGSEEPVELVTLKIVGSGVPASSRAALAAQAELPEGVAITEPVRRAYFGPAEGWLETAILNRAELRSPRLGPCIIEEYDSTCVVPPGCMASLDAHGNISIVIGAAPDAKHKQEIVADTGGSS
ncbi:MAG: hydantoinase/oxoprolinase family protein, partial [Acetobacteraceae bacterium]|nr:hydantoinase/oxoprolinase family protein [Acetobacteraceae bacterium]